MKWEALPELGTWGRFNCSRTPEALCLQGRKFPLASWGAPLVLSTQSW